MEMTQNDLWQKRIDQNGPYVQCKLYNSQELKHEHKGLSALKSVLFLKRDETIKTPIYISSNFTSVWII